MDWRPDIGGTDDRYLAELVGTTKVSVCDRLSDPYLTGHDRWVLRQFAMFLSGVTPEPDTRTPGVGGRARPLRRPSR